MTFILAQIVGAIAFVLEIATVQWRREQILFTQLIANGFWVVHFLLLGALSGAAMNVVGAIRSYVFYKTNHDRRSVLVLWAVLGLVLVAGMLTWQGWVSLLPIGGMITAVIAFWQLKEQRLRLLIFTSAPLWLAYNIIVGSYGGVANEIMLMVSSGIALWRYQQKRQKKH